MTRSPEQPVEDRNPIVGKTAYWNMEDQNGRGRYAGLFVQVRILKVRLSFGRLDYLVVPLRGMGEAWIRADRIVGARTDENYEGGED